MKNKVIMIAAVVFLAGLILTGTALGLTGFDVTKLNTGNGYQENTYECSTEIKDINIQESDTGIIVHSGNVENVVMRYFERKGEKYQIAENDGQLNVLKEEKMVFRFMDINLTDHKLEITVPKDFNGNLNIKQNDGSTRIMDLHAAVLKMESEDGSIKISDVETGTLEVSGEDGSIWLENVKNEADVSVKTKCSSIVMKEISGLNLTVSNRDGSITLNDGTIEKDVVLTNKDGSITVDRLDAGNCIKMENADGSIRGTIVGSENDFLIQSSAKDGTNKLQDTMTGDKKLQVINEDGGIYLKFTE